MLSNGKPKSKRNRTIDFPVADGLEELSRCLSVSEFSEDPFRKNVTVLGQAVEALSFIPDQTVDLLIVDPPYNREKVYSSTKYRRQTEEDYIKFTREWLAAVRPTLKGTASIYVCSDWQSSLLIAPLLTEFFQINNRITWQREKGRGAQRNWKNAHEDIWFCSLDESYFFNPDAVKMRRKVIAPYRMNGLARDWSESSDGRFRNTFHSNFWDDITIPFWSMPENTAHPTQKSEKLIAKLILASSREGDFVLDPFAGSGTTSVTAKKLGRRYLGIEREAQYCAWAEYRLANVDRERSIQGYSGGVFWERNSLAQQRGGA